MYGLVLDPSSGTEIYIAGALFGFMTHYTDIPFLVSSTLLMILLRSVISDEAGMEKGTSSISYLKSEM